VAASLPVSRASERSSCQSRLLSPGCLGFSHLPSGRRRWPPDIEDSSSQDSEPDRAICVVTGQPASRLRDDDHGFVCPVPSNVSHRGPDLQVCFMLAGRFIGLGFPLT
jgi:hypothetical protein